MKRLRVFLFAVILGLIALGGFLACLKYRMNAPGTNSETVRVLLTAQRSPLRVLEENGLLSSPFFFKINLYLKGHTKSLKRGEYDIPPKASMQTVLDMLVSGKAVQRSLTVPEGLSSFQIVEILQNVPELSGNLSVEKIPNNGTLLPETYSFAYNDSRQSVLIRMENAMTALIDGLMKDQTLFKTKTEALSMACLIEKETKFDDERPLVSAVFHNRLKKGMKMQSDPTVIFALTQGRYVLTRPLTFQDLKIQNPFNTYVIPGLPPEPICNPGKASVYAAFHPADVSYLFFVATPEGRHTFSSTLEEHNKNAEIWRSHIHKERRKLKQQQRLQEKKAAEPSSKE